MGQVRIPIREEDDPVRRRRFLLTAGSVVAAGATGVWPTTANAVPGDPDPAALLAQQLGNVLLDPTSIAEVVAVDRLRRAPGQRRAGLRHLPVRAGRAVPGAAGRGRGHCRAPVRPGRAPSARRGLHPGHQSPD
ncbi:MAG TPA: hypothetical protein VHW44_33255 [Pseudonocardiaceae bacterium]|nr:hypothetical protein [Pseudonocardiaceae bacterium]